MNKRFLCFSMLCAILCAFGIGALAEAETPTLDIAGSFDAKTWTVDGQEPLTPLDDFLRGLPFLDTVTLVRYDVDVNIEREVYVSNLGREMTEVLSFNDMDDGFRLAKHSYEARNLSEEEFVALIDSVQALQEKISIAAPDMAELIHAYDEIIAHTGPGAMTIWNTDNQIGEFNGMKLCGLFTIGYEKRTDDTYTLYVSFSFTNIKSSLS